MNVGKSLKLALVKDGRTQRAFALDLGFGPVWVSRLANQRSASMNTVETLAAAFGMSVSEFIRLGEE